MFDKVLLKNFTTTTTISTCFLIVYLQSDIYIVGNWHTDAVKEFEEEEAGNTVHIPGHSLVLCLVCLSAELGITVVSPNAEGKVFKSCIPLVTVSE